MVGRVTTISVTVVDDDPAEADRLSRELRTEILALDVDRAELVLDRAVPAGAKADAGTVETIVVALSASPVLVQLAGLLRDWVNRANHRKIVVRDGDRSLELTGGPVEDNRAAIEAFFR
jgi:Effector Associated Constant Component 1